MKTRIISAAVVIAVAAGLLALQFCVPVSLCIAAAALSVVAVYEMLFDTKITAYKPLIAAAMLFAAVVPFVLCGYLKLPLFGVYTGYLMITFALALKGHSRVTVTALAAALAFPLLLPGALAYLVRVVQHGNGGLFYILLVLMFSAVADTGAYFTGVFFGKHKMAPVISPKKTWEGFFGGLVWGLLGALVVCLIYSNALHYTVNFAAVLCAAPVFTLLGVLGDLSASLIKRQCGVKDYGSLIPGHGGIMDRFDSIMMIVPAFYLYISCVELIK